MQIVSARYCSACDKVVHEQVSGYLFGKKRMLELMNGPEQRNYFFCLFGNLPCVCMFARA